MFFLHNEGYSTMCGHAIIAITTLAFETGLIARTGERRELTINVPAGRIHSAAIMSGERVEHVSFRNVPSFAYQRDQRIEVPDLGSVRFDIAYGGAFYAIVEAQQLDRGLEPREFNASSTSVDVSSTRSWMPFVSNIHSKRISDFYTARSSPGQRSSRDVTQVAERRIVLHAISPISAGSSAHQQDCEILSPSSHGP